MRGFARFVLAFTAMMAIGYVGLVAFAPAPTTTAWKADDVTTGRSAATALSEQARSLVTRDKPSTSFR